MWRCDSKGPSVTRYEAERQRKEALRQKWLESEWILNILRTQGAPELEPATDEEIEAWAKKMN